MAGSRRGLKKKAGRMDGGKSEGMEGGGGGWREARRDGGGVKEGWMEARTKRWKEGGMGGGKKEETERKRDGRG